MIEEFAAILGCSLDSTTPITLPNLNMQFPDNLVAFFDMPPSDIYLYAYNPGSINLSSLINVYRNRDKSSVAWVRTVAFCPYSQFLLVSSYGEADTRIISILEQVETIANPMPVILAKTVIGLDNFKTQHHLSGSLLFLQLCNQNLLLFYY